MASTAQSIARIIPGVMSLGLVGEAIKTIPKMDKLGKPKKGDMKKRDAQFLKSTVKVLVGVPLVGIVAGQVGKLS